MICADCGRAIERDQWTGAWYDRRDTLGGRVANYFTCRNEIDFHWENPEAELELVSADYHYVEGETQRHWPS